MGIKMRLASTPVSLPARSPFSRSEVADCNAAFAELDASGIIAWAADRFGSRLVLTSSFADALLIDLAVAVAPDIEVVFLDTGFHFSETLETVRRAMGRYALNLTVLRPSSQAADVWAQGSDSCCFERKTEPLERHLISHADAWLSGLRRADDPARQNTPFIEVDRRGLVKLNPIAGWSDGDVARYIASNEVTVNPIAHEGYTSIGCWPCTELPTHENARSGRWAGFEKTECGLHL